MRVLVTGGTRGIGKAIAEKFRKEGHDVFITGTKPQPKMASFFIEADFSSEESIKTFLEKIKDIEFDVLINNAGVNDIKYIEDVSFEDYDNLFNVNLKAPYFLSKICSKHMKKNSRGWILNISSIMSVTSREKRTLYSTSKAALTGMVRALAAELGGDGIMVNCLSPGFTMTELTEQSLSQKEMKEFSSNIPLGRMAEVQEMAEIAYNLCNPKNTYLTGQNIIVDGGITIV